MPSIKDFFTQLGFTFGNKEQDLKPYYLAFPDNIELSQKLKNKVYVYNCMNFSNTSFYLFTVPLNKEELYEIRRFIWNQNKYDLYFTISNGSQNNLEYSIYYAQSNPRSPLKIDQFKGNNEDTDKLDRIRKWKFNSGAFWYEYVKIQGKIKSIKKIDEELISTLKRLRNDLMKVYDNCEGKKEIVQALIDRTLYIKYLEDNHIINSDFYSHYFEDKSLTYKSLLKPENKAKINKLFSLINSLFKNVLFRTPQIRNDDLSNDALYSIYHFISGTRADGQLSLFDFKFDVLPVEFIGNIYEVFLEEQQRQEGIYYTPRKLAKLIVDETITQIGTVLDPSCGSGIFLVLAFRKMKEYAKEPQDIREKINFRNKLAKDNVFGIEKQAEARRLAIFSLYLELLQGLDTDEINKFIKEKLINETENSLFLHDISENIINENSLEIEKGKIPHENLRFDFIVGNPPFGKINERNTVEDKFLKNHAIDVFDEESNTNIEYRIEDLVSDRQISQCFMLRIKDWAKLKTSFGFVLNTASFYNERAENFQTFFFKYFQLEKFYELSRVKKILFRKAQENVCALIFKNKKINNNRFDYQPVYLEKFSEIFNLLIIHKDKGISLEQKEILTNKIKLRDYLIGNEYDRKLLAYLSANDKLSSYIIDNKENFAVGIRITGSDKISKTDNRYNELTKDNKRKYFTEVKSSFISKEKTEIYTIPYIEYKDINSFNLTINKYVSEEDIREKRFRRNKDIAFFKSDKILLRKIPIKNPVYIYEAVYFNETLCFPDGVFCIRLKNPHYYKFIIAILNSKLISYYINQLHLKRSLGSFPHIGKFTIRNLPVPKIKYEDLIEINKLVDKIMNKRYNSKEIYDKLDNVVFDLYNLSILEKRRIEDFFAESREVNESDLDEYRKHLSQTLEIHFVTQPIIKAYIGTNLPFKMVVVAMYFNHQENHQPSENKYIQYILQEIISINPDENFITLKEKVFGKDCIYFLKDNNYLNWTTTKAYEDGQEVLKRLRG